MPEPEPAILRHQVLADPTGRRRRRLAIVGRVATTALGLWLVALILGGLGLQPLTGLPIVGDLGAGEAAPPAVPERVRAAVARRTTVAPAKRAMQAPVTTVPVPSRRPAVTKTRTTPATAPGRTKTTPGHGTKSPATAPGQTRTAPGQTKTGPGAPSSTPGKTRGGKGTVTTP
jgi:hypothetical protein